MLALAIRLGAAGMRFLRCAGKLNHVMLQLPAQQPLLPSCVADNFVSCTGVLTFQTFLSSTLCPALGWHSACGFKFTDANPMAFKGCVFLTCWGHLVLGGHWQR